MKFGDVRGLTNRQLLPNLVNFKPTFFGEKNFRWLIYRLIVNIIELEMWANAQRDGRPAEHRWRPRFTATKFGWRSLLTAVQ